MSDNALHEGHRERVRRRVDNEGLRQMEPHEVLEFLLFNILPRQDVNALAHRLIDRFTTVNAVLHAPVKDLKSVNGVGDKVAAFLSSVGNVMDNCGAGDTEDRPAMGRFADAVEQVMDFEMYVEKPSSCLFCLDMDSRLLFRREITPSLSWGESEVLQDVLADILLTRARCVVIVLYGSAAIDPYDVTHARDLAMILHDCGVALLDVILSYEGTIHSMRREGLIPELENGMEVRSLFERYVRSI